MNEMRNTYESQITGYLMVHDEVVCWWTMIISQAPNLER